MNDENGGSKMSTTTSNLGARGHFRNACITYLYVLVTGFAMYGPYISIVLKQPSSQQMNLLLMLPVPASIVAGLLYGAVQFPDSTAPIPTRGWKWMLLSMAGVFLWLTPTLMLIPWQMQKYPDISAQFPAILLVIFSGLSVSAFQSFATRISAETRRRWIMTNTLAWAFLWVSLWISDIALNWIIKPSDETSGNVSIVSGFSLVGVFSYLHSWLLQSTFARFMKTGQ
jgi:hypothetical protein